MRSRGSSRILLPARRWGSGHAQKPPPIPYSRWSTPRLTSTRRRRERTDRGAAALPERARMSGLSWATCLTLAWGVFAFGAVYPQTYIPLLLASAVIGGLALMGAADRRAGLACLAIAAPVLGAIALQLIPL